jgi:fucose permease
MPDSKSKIRWILVIAYLSFVGLGLPNAMVGAAWPSMYMGLGVPDSYLGIVSFIIMVCVVVSSMFTGFLTRRFSNSTLIVAGAIMISVSLIGFAFSGMFVLLCLCAVPMGLALGYDEAVLDNFVATNLKANHMNWMHCCWSIGAMIGPVVLGFGLTRFGSWRWGFLAIGGVLVGIVLFMLFGRKMWKNTANNGLLSKPENCRMEETVAPKEKAKINILFIRGIKPSLMSFFAYVAFEMTIIFWGSSYLVMEKGVEPETAANLLSLYFVGMTLGRLAGGFLSFRFSNLQNVRLSYLLVATGIAVLFVPVDGISYVAGFLLLGIGSGPIFPGLMHDTPKLFGKERSQAIVGLQVASAHIGSAIAPPLFGLMSVRTGYGIFPFFVALFLLVMVVSIEILHRKTASTL